MFRFSGGSKTTPEDVYGDAVNAYYCILEEKENAENGNRQTV